MSMLKEFLLVRAVLNHRPGSVNALAEHLLGRKEYFKRVTPMSYVAAWGGIRVCADICGYEVQLGWAPFAELLDCNPDYYGLTRESADKVYKAILACIPGTIYANKETM